MGRLKAIIFDVDGTLADTEKNGHLVACNEAFAQMGFDIHWSWEEFKDLLKIPGNARRMRLALSAHTSLSESEIDRIVPELFELKKELYLKRVGELPLYPGVARIIREAIDRGIRLAIVSVTHDDQILALLKAQIPEALDAFNPIFGRQSGTKTRPSMLGVRQCSDAIHRRSWLSRIPKRGSRRLMKPAWRAPSSIMSTRAARTSPAPSLWSGAWSVWTSIFWKGCVWADQEARHCMRAIDS